VKKIKAKIDIFFSQPVIGTSSHCYIDAGKILGFPSEIKTGI
jgi:hypothetical protein